MTDLLQDLPETDETLFESVPHSTPQKHKADEPTATFKVPFAVKLASPSPTKPAVLLAPTWTKLWNTTSSSMMITLCSPRKSLIYAEPDPIGATAMDMSATSVFDVSMTSETALDPAEISFVPDSSPSTSTTGMIEEAYIQQEDIIKARIILQSEEGDGVQLCGDGRSDSPGHSSKYTTYSFMDDSTKQIVGFELMQVSQASSSIAMEPLCFKKALDEILNEGIDVKVVTTDRHPSIRKIMREEYPNIIHQFDPWHVAKGFKKKLKAASKRRDCRDEKELLRRWMSLQHHITGVHRWEENGTEYKCFHQDLSAQEQRTKRWLKVNSPSFQALKSMMTDTRLLKDLQQMTLFKHTGQLEVFHNALLKSGTSNNSSWPSKN
uniref:Transposase n=1 Tax=Knipowitschia caucasica TaxID=637954 RepID=A0AAV2K1T2_KNICA